jgi:hypothetical protein
MQIYVARFCTSAFQRIYFYALISAHSLRPHTAFFSDTVFLLYVLQVFVMPKELSSAPAATVAV